MHSVTVRRSDGQADGRQDYVHSRSHWVRSTVRSAKMNEADCSTGQLTFSEVVSDNRRWRSARCEAVGSRSFNHTYDVLHAFRHSLTTYNTYNVRYSHYIVLVDQPWLDSLSLDIQSSWPWASSGFVSVRYLGALPPHFLPSLPPPSPLHSLSLPFLSCPFLSFSFPFLFSSPS